MLSELSTRATPFDPAFKMQQDVVNWAKERVQNLSSAHQSISTYFAITSTSIDQNLAVRFAEIDNSLATLKAASTTVFVLASTTEELMNRTIEELLVAQNEVSKIITLLLPDTQASADFINSEFSNASMTAQNLVTYIDLLLLQVQMLNNVSATVQQLSNFEKLPELTSSHYRNVKNATDLQNREEDVTTGANSLSNELLCLGLAINSTAVRIKNELESLDSVPENTLLQELIMSTSDTNSYAVALMDMVQQHKNRLDSLMAELQDSKKAISGLLQLESTLSVNVTILSEVSTQANHSIASVVTSTEQAIQRAEYILEKLLNFQNDSFQINSATSMVSAHLINSRAMDALAEITETQENVQVLVNDSNAANSISEEARYVVQEMQKVSITKGGIAYKNSNTHTHTVVYMWKHAHADNTLTCYWS